MSTDDAGKGAASHEAFLLIKAKALRRLQRLRDQDDANARLHLLAYKQFWRRAMIHEAAGRRRLAKECRTRAEFHLALCQHSGPPHRPAIAARAPRPAINTLAYGRDAGDKDNRET